MVANTLPAINDITAPELRALLSAAAQHCPIIHEAREAAIKVCVDGVKGVGARWGAGGGRTTETGVE